MSRWANKEHTLWCCSADDELRLADNSTCEDSHTPDVRWCGRCWSVAPDATAEEIKHVSAVSSKRFDATLRRTFLGHHAGRPGPSGYQGNYGNADPDWDGVEEEDRHLAGPFLFSIDEGDER